MRTHWDHLVLPDHGLLRFWVLGWILGFDWGRGYFILQKVSTYKIMFLNPSFLKSKVMMLQRGVITWTLAIALFLN